MPDFRGLYLETFSGSNGCRMLLGSSAAGADPFAWTGRAPFSAAGWPAAAGCVDCVSGAMRTMPFPLAMLNSYSVGTTAVPRIFLTQIVQIGRAPERTIRREGRPAAR